MNGFRTIAVTLLLAASAAPAAAQNPPAGARPMPGAAQAPQAPGAIRGAVLDATSGRPLSAANVAIWSAADSTLVSGAVTRNDGIFRIEGLRPGRYYARVSYLGYATHTAAEVTLTAAAPQADLGAIRLAVSAVELEGVAVTGERSQLTMAPDRNTFLVRDMPAVAGGTASDVLRNVPALEVDIDGKVSLRGNQNVAIQINGRAAPMRGEQLAQFLQQLPANMVERIEVIPNPSARFDPDGMAGIVNIQLRQNTDLGTSGGVTLGGGTGERVNVSGNLGYQRGALTLFGNYGFFTDERQTTGSNYRENRYTSPLTYLEQDMLGIFSPTAHNFNGSGELKLGKLDLLSSSLLVSRRAFDVQNTNLYLERDAGRDVTGRSSRVSDNENDDLTLDASLAFRRTRQPREHEFSAEARFNRSDNSVSNLFTQQALGMDGGTLDQLPGRETNELGALTNNWTLQTDYTRPFGGGLRLETGYKGTLRQLDNDFAVALFDYDRGEFVPDEQRSNSFGYDEQVHAGYAVLSGKRGPLDLQGGLRLEQAMTEFALTTTGERFDNDYFSIFPSALAAYNLSESRQLKASYSKRIQRPQTQFLNPFAFYEDPLNLFRGNPYLQPEYTHAFELGYQQNSQLGTLQVTPYFRRTVDAVRRTKTVDDEGVSTTTFRNFATSDSWGTDLTGSLRLGRLSGFAGVNAFRTVTDGSNVEEALGSETFSWNARLNASWRVTSRLDAQGFFMYRAPQNVELGRISSHSMLHFGLRQKLLGDRASVSLRVVDPFDQMGFSFRTSDDRHYQVSSRKFGARGAYLSFSYNFGQAPRLRQRPQEQQEPSTGGDIGIQ